MKEASQLYVVRIWHEPSEHERVWRASATNTQTQEKRYFSSPEDLKTFLEGASPNPERNFYEH